MIDRFGFRIASQLLKIARACALSGLSVMHGIPAAFDGREEHFRLDESAKPEPTRSKDQIGESSASILTSRGQLNELVGTESHSREDGIQRN